MAEAGILLVLSHLQIFDRMCELRMIWPRLGRTLVTDARSFPHLRGRRRDVKGVEADDDSFMNEDEWVNIDSDDNFNDGEDLVDDDDNDDDNYYLEEEGEGGEDKKMKPRNKHVTKKRNCRAKINKILEENGSQRISKVVKKYNHQLEPALSRLMDGHKSLSNSLKRALIAKDIVGLRPSKNIRVAEVLAGGPDNLGYTLKDCRNYILKSKKFQLQEEDAQSLLKSFSDMQQKDREFYYSVDMDSFGRLRNVV
nr:protein FAR-RED IMPAIRED RESPONSE 1-like [Nicotiana tomentosiformis]